MKDADLEKEFELVKKRTYKVVKDNDLIQKAQFSLTATQQKIICYIISLVKPEDDIFGMYEIKVRDYAELSGTPLDHIYNEFKDMIDDLDQKAFWVKDGDKTFKFRWFSEAEYIEKKGILRVMLNSNMKQYLLHLQNNFTSYELWNILALKSKWSIRLYEVFKSYEFLEEKTFNVEELKELLGATNYKQFGDFKKRVLEKAKDEINQFTDINIDYKTEQSGKEHKITSITFMIDKKDYYDGYLSYRKTIDIINKRNKSQTIKGQLRLNLDGSITEEKGLI